MQKKIDQFTRYLGIMAIAMSIWTTAAIVEKLIEEQQVVRSFISSVVKRMSPPAVKPAQVLPVAELSLEDEINSGFFTRTSEKMMHELSLGVTVIYGVLAFIALLLAVMCFFIFGLLFLVRTR